MSVAESFSSSPPPAENSPQDLVFEAIKDGRIAELFAHDTRNDVEDNLTGSDSDYISLTPVPGRMVERDEAALRAMQTDMRQGGEAAIFD